MILPRKKKKPVSVASQAQPQPLSQQSSLTLLLAETREDMAQVNHLILREIENSFPLIASVTRHLMAYGGKRLRPLLTLACARLCGYEGEQHQQLAACIEFIHTATLLHDDVVDHSMLRRGNATAHTVWGEKASVLVGDFLLSRSFQLMVQVNSLEVMATLSQAAAKIAEGEVMQLAFQRQLELSQEQYMEIITSKTACLFQAACEMGALLTHQPAPVREALRQYGLSLGIAFQLMDDALDYQAQEKVLGKKIGQDFQEGKVTFPSLWAYTKASEGEKAFWQRTLQDLTQQEGDLEEALHLCEKTGSLRETMSLAQRYAEHAINALGIFPASPLRLALEEAALFSCERSS